jgi:VCBS repeat-containing protein
MTTISGDDTDNVLSGTNKADVISGGAGGDVIDGGNGNDVISGGSGSDVIDGGNGNDVISGGSGSDVIDGGNGNDVISGGSGSDVIDGGNGNDVISGGSGNDVISGDSGNDVILGGSGNDLLLGGSGNDVLEGGSGNDTLNGGSGQDVLLGGSGNDILIGVEGADWMLGGAGNDVFGYLSASDSNSCEWDRIIDFAQGKDKIDLAALLGQTDLAWGDTTAVANGAWYQNSGSSTFVFADTTGDGKADLKIELKNASSLKLTTSDFLGVGMAPVANDGAAQGNEDTVLTGTLVATDPDGGTLNYGVVNGPAHGTLVVHADGSFSYTPEANFNGSDGFTYKANDGSSDSNVATVKLTVDPVNDAATITGSTSGSVTEDGDLTASGVLTVSDVDTGEARFQGLSNADLGGAFGDFTFDATSGAWSYTLNSNAANVQALNGGATVHDSLIVKSFDDTASSAITVDITGTNDAATIMGDAKGKVTEDGPQLDTFGNLNIKDVDTGEAVFQSAAPESLAGIYGNFTFNELTGAWTYTLDQSKADSLTENQQVTDALVVKSLDGMASETIAVDITGTNDDATITGNTSGAVVEAGGVANGTPGMPGASGDLVVSDVDAGQAMFQAVAQASLAGNYGNFTFNAGAWTYTLDQSKADSLAENQPATDALMVKSLDGTASETITVNITGTNDAPVANPDEATAIDDGNVISPDAIGTVLTDDTDPDTGATLAVTTVAFNGIISDGFDDPIVGGFGQVFMSSSGAWTYKLNAGATDTIELGTSADDVFDYTIVDEHGAIASSTLTISVTGTGAPSGGTSSTGSTPPTTPGTGANSAPDAVADDAYGTFGNVLANDTDVDGNLLNVTAISFNGNAGELYDPLSGDYGFLTIDESGSWTYTPTSASGGDDVFDYTIADGNGGMDSSTLTIHSGDFIL